MEKLVVGLDRYRSQMAGCLPKLEIPVKILSTGIPVGQLFYSLSLPDGPARDVGLVFTTIIAGLNLAHQGGVVMLNRRNKHTSIHA